MFIAVSLSPEIKGILEEVIRGLRPCCAHARFTQIENLHLTIVFLGEIPPYRLDAVTNAMDSISVSSFFLHIGGFGYFRRQGGDIFWAGVERSQALMTLHHQICTQLQNRDFHLEQREFRPHLTLARQAVLKQEYDHNAFVVPVLKMPVEKITLFQSTRQDGRLRYIPIYDKFLLKEKNL